MCACKVGVGRGARSHTSARVSALVCTPATNNHARHIRCRNSLFVATRIYLHRYTYMYVCIYIRARMKFFHRFPYDIQRLDLRRID